MARLNGASYMSSASRLAGSANRLAWKGPSQPRISLHEPHAAPSAHNLIGMADAKQHVRASREHATSASSTSRLWRDGDQGRTLRSTSGRQAGHTGLTLDRFIFCFRIQGWHLHCCVMSVGASANRLG